MESVIQQIQQSRNDKNKKRIDINIIETVIDDCQVKMRFDAIGDNKIITAIKSMLLSAHLEAAFSALPGGESV